MTTNIFERQKTEWIEEAREVAHRLLKRQYSITIEDVLRVHPLPAFLHRNTIGSVFSRKKFKHIGYQPSAKQSSHGRIISIWTAKIGEDEPDNLYKLPLNYRRVSRRTFGREE